MSLEEEQQSAAESAENLGEAEEKKASELGETPAPEETDEQRTKEYRRKRLRRRDNAKRSDSRVVKSGSMN